jgi:hypothetical protein
LSEFSSRWLCWRPDGLESLPETRDLGTDEADKNLQEPNSVSYGSADVARVPKQSAPPASAPAKGQHHSGQPHTRLSTGQIWTVRDPDPWGTRQPGTLVVVERIVVDQLRYRYLARGGEIGGGLISVFRSRFVGPVEDNE